MAGGDDTTGPSEYIPGVCNIGLGEQRLRRRLGWLGVAATIALWAAFILLGINPIWRLTLFFPAAMAAVGLLQAAWHFCAAFGLLGLLNVGLSVGSTDSVEQAAFRREDRRKALQILGLSAAVGAGVAAAGYLIPI